jgi:large subunit ribosomal protein L4
MNKLNVYTAKGVKKSPVSFPKAFQEKENPVLLAQAIRVYEWRKHPGLSKVKTRGEIVASTRKIYRQKGTGRARHGAKSAPIFVGGGKAHGPRGVKRKLAFPRKMRQKALKIALTMKAKDKAMIVIEEIASLKKTKEAQQLLNKIVAAEKDVGKKTNFTFALADKNLSAERALRNLERAQVIPFRNLNVYNVFFSGVLAIDKDVFGEGKSLSSSKRKTKKEGKGK